ncbi:MAG: HPr family phosphocarrier protein [Planctomycetota bacterium]|nr:MAG: HPr family phosphocarrier protein [Planctomycetota bacterium]
MSSRCLKKPTPIHWYAKDLKSSRVLILNRLGLHARPAMAFASMAGTFRCAIKVHRIDNQERVDGKSVMQMLMLACTQGTEIEIEADGVDAAEAIVALRTLVEGRFEEE